ncbi:MAG: tetratricopeptide repeat protein [Desulfobaccales bacterium]
MKHNAAKAPEAGAPGKTALVSRFDLISRHQRFIICLLLVALTCAAYWQVRDFQFITCDDDMYVYENPLVRAGLSWEGVKWSFTAYYSANWHPLTWLSHILDSQVYGLQAGGHHLTNLFFHLANTLLLFLFFARTTGALWSSALVAALFALHPMHVESVAWVSERKDVLSTFFWLATMWAYVWYVSAPNLKRYLSVLLCFGLGLMSKPMLVTLPFVLLLLDYWPLNRLPSGVTPAAQINGARESRPRLLLRLYWPLIREKTPLFLLTILSCLITLAAQRAGGAVMPLSLQSLGARLANAAVAYVTYGLKLFWPYPMALFYILNPVPWWQAVVAGLALLGLSALVLYGARRYPYLAVGWLWYLGTLVPVIGLVQVGGQAMADRYTYIPFIGLFILLAWGVPAAAAGWRRRETILALAAAAALSACLVSSWGQAGYWRNAEALFTHSIRVTGDNYLAYHHLGMALSGQGRYDQAIAMYRKTLSIAPGYPPAYNNLGIIYARQGRVDEAVELFKHAIQLTPGNLSYYRNLALAYNQQGKSSEAEGIMRHMKWLTGQR